MKKYRKTLINPPREAARKFFWEGGLLGFSKFHIKKVIKKEIFSNFIIFRGGD